MARALETFCTHCGGGGSGKPNKRPKHIYFVLYGTLNAAGFRLQIRLYNVYYYADTPSQSGSLGGGPSSRPSSHKWSTPRNLLSSSWRIGVGGEKTGNALISLRTVGGWAGLISVHYTGKSNDTFESFVCAVSVYKIVQSKNGKPVVRRPRTHGCLFLSFFNNLIVDNERKYSVNHWDCLSKVLYGLRSAKRLRNTHVKNHSFHSISYPSPPDSVSLFWCSKDKCSSAETSRSSIFVRLPF